MAQVLTVVEQSDTALIELALGGDAEAVETLFERHYRRVYRLAFTWCGKREDAEDIAQEVFVKLVHSLEGFRSRSSFTTWLYRIVVNTARDHWRRGAVRREREAEFAERTALDPPGPAATPGNPGLDERLGTAVDDLPQKQREAVLLVYGEGLTHREAAGVLGCMEATVSWRIFQAHKVLKQSMRGEA